MIFPFVFVSCNTDLKRELQESQAIIKECTTQNTTANEPDWEELQFEEIVGQLISWEIAHYLRNDKTLEKMVKEEVRILLSTKYSSTEHPWATAEGKQYYSKWLYRVEKSGLDKGTKALLYWAPSKPYTTDVFSVRQKPESQDICVRGILPLTYKQAVRLGVDAQPSVFYAGKKPTTELQLKLLEKELSTLDIDNHTLPKFDKNQSIMSLPQDKQDQYCIYPEGKDDRAKAIHVLKSLQKIYDSPSLEGANPIIKIALIDFLDLENQERETFEKLQRTTFRFSYILKEATLPNTTWILQQTAEKIARAMVLPCMIALDGDYKTKSRFFEMMDPPNAIACYALKWRAEEE